MSNQSQKPTAIVGGTQPALNTEAAPAATKTRIESMKEFGTRYKHFFFWTSFITIGVILANSDLSFASAVILSVGLIIIGNLMANSKNESFKPWHSFLRGAGMVVLVTILLTSGFGELLRSNINSVEEMAAAAASETVAKDSSETKVTDGSKQLDVPAEGMIITIKPEMKLVRFMVPADNCGFRNYIPTATVEDIARGSWMDYLTQGPASGRQESLLVKRGLTEPLEVMVDPFTRAEARAEGVEAKYCP